MLERVMRTSGTLAEALCMWCQVHSVLESVHDVQSVQLTASTGQRSRRTDNGLLQASWV